MIGLSTHLLPPHPAPVQDAEEGESIRIENEYKVGSKVREKSKQSRGCLAWADPGLLFGTAETGPGWLGQALFVCVY